MVSVKIKNNVVPVNVIRGNVQNIEVNSAVLQDQKEIFIATTENTSAELEEAYQEGKILFALFPNEEYHMSTIYSFNRRVVSGGLQAFYFSYAGKDFNVSVTCTNNGWTTPVTTYFPMATSTKPSDLGQSADSGTSDHYARIDHVHKMPSATDVGAVPTPQSPSVGDFMVYTENGWGAQSLATWQGGSY